MKDKRSKLALVGLVLTGIYLIYLITHFAGANTAAVDDSEQVGAAIATMLILPHAVLVFLGAVFNGLGYFLRKRGFVLTAGILYAVGLAAFVPYFMFVVVQMILMFVAFAKMRADSLHNSPI